MPIRPFRREDAAVVAEISASCTRSEADFVLNPFWETQEELFSEFDRFGIAPEEHLFVADPGDGEVLGVAGFLRRPGARDAGMFCPIVKRGERGQGLGGELLRGVQRIGSEELGIRLMTAGIGTRNRGGYSLLTSHGFRPSRQAFLMMCALRPDVRPPPVEGLVLEDASPDDADAILEIYSACGFEERSPEQMRATLGDGRHVHSVGRHEGRVVAFVELETHWARRAWVAFVGVWPALRDRGVGSNLVSWSLARRFDGGVAAGLLMLSPANRTALRAYEKVGFRRHRVVDVLQKSF